jgi:hypothetical protein
MKNLNYCMEKNEDNCFESTSVPNLARPVILDIARRILNRTLINRLVDNINGPLYSYIYILKMKWLG